MNDILKLSLTDCAKAIKEKQVSSLEVTKACLDKINECKKLNNFISVVSEKAIEKAKSVDERIAKGEKTGALAGVPVSLKDNITTNGIKTTCAAKFLENYVPSFDASIVTALKNADAVVVGKTNMNDFGTDETSYFGEPLNVNNTEYSTGGSSGGAANSVASNEVFAGIGTDTDGCIRRPASVCGVVGFKPTYSLVSRYGIISSASSFDQAGTLTRDVSDTAALMNVISFHDKKDTLSSVKNFGDFTKFDTVLKGKRIGVIKEFISEALPSDLRAVTLKSIEILKALGAVIEEVSFKNFDAALAAYNVISSAEASSNFARFDGLKFGYVKESDNINDLYYDTRTSGFGEGAKRVIMTGNYVLSSSHYDEYFIKACKVRTVIKNEFDTIFSKFDALISPVLPSETSKAGNKNTDRTQAYLSGIYTVPANIAGLPAISVPCGKSKNNLPVGVQLIGKAFDDIKLLSIANGLFLASNGGKN